MNIDSDSQTVDDCVEGMTSGRNALNLVAEEEATPNYQDTINQIGPQNSTSPIMASLPLDIVSEIFLTACADPNQEPYDTSRLPVQFLIGKICKAWREFAWSTPRLWRNVRITLSEERFDVQKCLLEEWIKRSSDCPLDLQIDISYSSSPWEPFSDAFCVIAKSTHRWESLICPAFTGLFLALAQREPFRLPLLKYLKLCMVPQSSNESTQLKWNFEDAPRLQSLNTREGTPKRLLANWANLVHLWTDIHFGPTPPSGRYFDMSFNSLALCTSLRSLHCMLDGQFPTQSTLNQSLCCFSQLQDLNLHAKPSICAKFLSSIITPSLKKIELALGFLCDEDAGAETWTAAILMLAKRSSFNLVAFSIQQQYEYDIEILDMLRQLSSTNSIEQLQLMSAPANKFPLSDRMMELLTIDVHGDEEEQKEHFPMLNWFSYNGHISFSIASVSSMLESRMKYQMKRAHQPETQNLPLHIHIGYHSRKWFKRKHPNDVKSFYKFIEEFSTDGRRFHLYASLNPMDSSEDEDDVE